MLAYTHAKKKWGQPPFMLAYTHAKNQSGSQEEMGSATIYASIYSCQESVG